MANTRNCKSRSDRKKDGPFFCRYKKCTHSSGFRGGVLHHVSSHGTTAVFRICDEKKCQNVVYEGEKEDHVHKFADKDGDEDGGGKTSGKGKKSGRK